jgi:hypothetical protein
LVAGLHKNNILNSPIQWICHDCEKQYSADAADGIPLEGRRQFTFLSHDHRVLAQLEEEFPGTYRLFPFHLGWKSGTTKELAELIFFCSEKGMGPSAVHGLTKTFHWLEWQKSEILWIQHLLLRIQDPLITDSPEELKGLKRNLSWFPTYTSKEICGIVPSANGLVDFYCKITQARRAEYDSQMIRKYQSSSIFSIDASYKVPKWMASWMGEKMYDALITSKNEYFESLMSFFALSDNHKELKSELVRLRDLGFQPDFAFSDVPKRDRSLLEEVFSTLREGLTDIDDENEDDLPILPFRDEPLYLYQPENALAALALFVEAVDQSEHKAVSFDLEYSVYDDGRESGDPSLLTFATINYKKVLAIHIGRMGAQKGQVLQSVKALLGRSDFLFVGSRIASDVTKLKKSFPHIPFKVPNVMDLLGFMAVYRGVVPYKKGHTGLGPLVRSLLSFRLEKDNENRVSSVWDRPGDLLRDALLYASKSDCGYS